MTKPFQPPPPEVAKTAKPKPRVVVPPREVAKYQPSPKSKLKRALKPIKRAVAPPSADQYDRQTHYGTHVAKPPPQAKPKLPADQYDRATHFGRNPGAAKKIIKNVQAGQHRDQLHALDLLHTAFDKTAPTNHRLAAARVLRTQYSFPTSQQHFVSSVTPKIVKPKKHHSLLHNAAHDLLHGVSDYAHALTNAKQTPDKTGQMVVDYMRKLESAKNPGMRPMDETSRALGEALVHPKKAFIHAARGHQQEASVGPQGGDYLVGAAKAVKGTVEHPGKVAKATLKSVPNIAAGLLAAPVEAVMDPVKAGKGLKADLKVRYGPNADKVVQQTGLLPYALDAATVATPLGRGLGKSAEAGALGKVGTRIMAERPNLRVGAESVPQRTHPNFFKAAGGHVADISREKAAAKRSQTGNVRAIEPQPGEVVHRFNRNATRQVRRQFATVRGRGTNQMSHEKRQVLDKFFKEHVNQLSKDQKEHGAFRYALEHGIHTPEAAREFLPHLRQLVLENRAHREELFKLDHQHWVENGKRGKEPKLPKRVEDEIPHLDHLIKNPHLFDEKLRETVIKARDLGKELGLSDPALAEHVAEERALTPQMALLDAHQKANPVRPTTSTVKVSLPRKKVEIFDEAATRKAIERQGRKHRKYEPTPEGIAGKTFYHGTAADLSHGHLDSSVTNAQGLFGQGVYLTDDPSVARGYARARAKGGVGHVYAVRVSPHGVLDLQARAHPEFVDALTQHARNLAGVGDGALAARIENLAKKGATNDRLYKEFREGVADFSHDEGISGEALTEDFQALASDLRKRGFDALTHVGGLRTKSGPRHQTVILLDPADTGALGKTSSVRNVAETTPRHLPSSSEIQSGRTVRITRTGKAARPDVGPRRGGVLRPVATMKDGESLADFKARAAETRSKAGLAEPGYFPHVPFVKPRLSDLTHGAAAKGAVKGAEATKYDLFSHGEAATNTHALYNAYARNLKRKYNWNFVANTVKDFALSHLYDKTTGEAIPTQGLSLHELETAVERSGVTGVRFYHPGKILNDAPDTELTLHDLTTLKDKYNAATSPGNFKDEKGWYLIPEEVHKEMESSLRWNGFTGRLFSKAKSFSSRMILGLNPSWAMIQVASNALMATMGGVHPGDWAAARKYLSPEMLDAIRPYTQSYAFEGDRHSVHFGASAPRGMSEVLQYLHAMHDSPGGMGKFMRGAQKANPLDFLFRADAAQNAFFREAVAWSKIKKDAYANMGHGMAGALRAYDRLRTAKGQDAIYNLLTDPKYLNDLAIHVDEILGNWTTFTAKERLTLQNNVMFYGFLRYSLRLLFWTMPAKHPIMLNVGVSLSRLHEKETRDLLGAGPNDPLPFGALASVYYKKHGKLYQMNFARLNPAMNALVSAQDPAAAITGVVPPLWAELGQQITNLNFFKRMPFRVDGKAAPVSPLHWNDIPLGTRLRIAGEHFMQLAAPYRVAEQIKFAGQPQGEDSMLLSPRPVQHTSVQGILKDLNAQDQAKKRGTVGTLLKSQVPFLPQESQDKKVTLQLKRAQQKLKGVPLTPQEQVQDLKTQVEAPNFAKNYVKANLKAAKIKTDREMKKNKELIKRIQQSAK